MLGTHSWNLSTAFNLSKLVRAHPEQWKAILLWHQGWLVGCLSARTLNFRGYHHCPKVFRIFQADVFELNSAGKRPS